MGLIQAKFSLLSQNYPRRDVKDPDLYKYVTAAMKKTSGTPCCVQISHALNMAGIKIPERSFWRANVQLTIDDTDYFYIQATNELEVFMADLCKDEGELINKNENGGIRTMGGIKKYIEGRTGLLLFRNVAGKQFPPPHQFEHTELWDGKNILQRDMNEAYLFARPYVRMWDTQEAEQMSDDC